MDLKQKHSPDTQKVITLKELENQSPQIMSWINKNIPGARTLFTGLIGFGLVSLASCNEKDQFQEVPTATIVEGIATLTQDINVLSDTTMTANIGGTTISLVKNNTTSINIKNLKEMKGLNQLIGDSIVEIKEIVESFNYEFDANDYDNDFQKKLVNYLNSNNWNTAQPIQVKLYIKNEDGEKKPVIFNLTGIPIQIEQNGTVYDSDTSSVNGVNVFHNFNAENLNLSTQDITKIKRIKVNNSLGIKKQLKKLFNLDQQKFENDPASNIIEYKYPIKTLFVNNNNSNSGQTGTNNNPTNKVINR